MSEIALPNLLLISVFAGLQELDGINSKDSFVPFKFEDKTTWLIADNTEAIRRVLSSYNTAKKSLAKQHGIQEGMPITDKNMTQVADFMEALGALEAREVPVPGLVRITRASLATAKNPIKPSTLAKLSPILE